MTKKEKAYIKEHLRKQVLKTNREWLNDWPEFDESRHGLTGVIRFLAGMNIFTNVVLGGNKRRDVYIERVTVVFPDSIFPEVVFDASEKEVTSYVCCG